MRKTVLYLFLLPIAFICTGDLRPCTSVVVGRKATKDGSVLFGHNEDDFGRCVVNAWIVPGTRHAEGETVQFQNGGRIEQASETWSTLWFQVNELPFSDCYCNEWGVTVASDACPSREDRPDLTDGGIGFPLRRIVAERARSAREGVKLAGSLLDRFGYASSGRTLVICDPEEGWLLSMVAGKHWVAQRVPDDGVVVLPNTYVVGKVEADTASFLGSKDPVADYARIRGWWTPERGSPFHFAEAYRSRIPDPEASKKRRFDLRQWRGLSLLSGQTLPEEKAEENGLPFCIRPERKIGPEDVMALLRDHYEGTPYAVSPSPESNPHHQAERPICAYATLFSFVAQLRRFMPLPMRARLWVAYGRPDTSPFVPWYSGMTAVPRGFHNTPGVDSPDSALARHFNPVPGTYDPDPDAAFWIFKLLADCVNEGYFQKVGPVAAQWLTFEGRISASLKTAEKEAIRLYRVDPEKSRAFLTERSQSFAGESVRLAGEMIRNVQSAPDP